jgi:hypothetical protein
MANNHDDNPETTEGALFGRRTGTAPPMAYSEYLAAMAAYDPAKEAGAKFSVKPLIQPIRGGSFRVQFSRFGDNPEIDVGSFVSAISLPSMVAAGDVCLWNPVLMTLIDDIDNKMISQVMTQYQKQKSIPRTHFELTLDLLQSGNPIRRYIHTGCTIGCSRHDRDLDYTDPTTIPYQMQVQVENVTMVLMGWSPSNPVYDPIAV